MFEHADGWRLILCVLLVRLYLTTWHVDGRTDTQADAAAVLAPEVSWARNRFDKRLNDIQGWGPIASWFVGWSNFCGFVTGPCSVNCERTPMCGHSDHSGHELTRSPCCRCFGRYVDHCRSNRIPKLHSGDVARLLDASGSADHARCCDYAVYEVHRLGQQDRNDLEYRCGFDIRHLVPGRFNQYSENELFSSSVDRV